MKKDWIFELYTKEFFDKKQTNVDNRKTIENNDNVIYFSPEPIFINQSLFIKEN